MSRDYDPRSHANTRTRDDEVERIDMSRAGRGGADPRDDMDRHRDVFTRGLSLPRESQRQRVITRDRTYELRGSEVRMLAAIGAFRTVPRADFETQDVRGRGTRDKDIEHRELPASSKLARSVPAPHERLC
jgi:hypothetical protein